MRRTMADRALVDVLRSIREQKGITQEALAFKADVAISALSRIERGVNSPTWRTIQAIAGALDVNMIELATAIESSDPRPDAPASTAGVNGAGGRHNRSAASGPGSLEPSMARVVLACVPLTSGTAADAATIATEAEIVQSTARQYLDALVAVGDVLRVPGEPIRFYVSEQGDRLTRQEALTPRSAKHTT